MGTETRSQVSPSCSDDDGDVEIFVGGDSTPAGYVDHLGGVFRAIDYPSQSDCGRRANEVFHSSPAIGDINGDGRFEAVAGVAVGAVLFVKLLSVNRCRELGLPGVGLWCRPLQREQPVLSLRRTFKTTATPAVGELNGERSLVFLASRPHANEVLSRSDNTGPRAAPGVGVDSLGAIWPEGRDDTTVREWLRSCIATAGRGSNAAL